MHNKMNKYNKMRSSSNNNRILIMTKTKIITKIITIKNLNSKNQADKTIIF